MSAPTPAKKEVPAEGPDKPQEKTPEKTNGPAAVGKRAFLRRWIVPLFILLLAAVILFSITNNWNSWVGHKEVQKTDDAYLRSDITPLSTKISGTVSQVAVEDYQKVKAGDLLVQIKDDDYRAQVEQAEAAIKAAQVALVNNLKQKDLQDTRISQSMTGIDAAKADIAQAEASIEAAKADLANTQAGIDATKADVERTQLEKNRQEALLSVTSATKQKFEQVVADEERFRATLASRQAEQEKARAQLALRRADLARAKANFANKQEEFVAQRKQRSVLDVQEDQLKADLSAKEASLKVVKTNLEYTRIVAPTDGVVGERKVRVGQLVSLFTRFFGIVKLFHRIFCFGVLASTRISALFGISGTLTLLV